MNYQLTLTHMLERAAKLFPRKEIASRMPDGSMHRYTYADYHGRVHRLAHLLERLGIGQGDRVGTLCWNSFRHLELYFAVPCFGAVLVKATRPRRPAGFVSFLKLPREMHFHFWKRLKEEIIV